jgi:hypothetical protein
MRRSRDSADFEKHYDISDYRRKLEAVYYDVLNKTRHSPVPAEFQNLKCRRAQPVQQR